MSEVANDTFKNLTDKRIDKIIQFLEELNYPNSVYENQVLPYIAQWLYDNKVRIESTCLIISTIINIDILQEKIDNIYDEVLPPLPAKSHLQEFLSEENYGKLEKLLDPPKKETSKGEIDDYTNIITNFMTKQVLQEKISFNRKGENESVIRFL